MHDQIREQRRGKKRRRIKECDWSVKVMYKVGDRVELIKEDKYYPEKGAIGTICKNDPGIEGVGVVFVNWDGYMMPRPVDISRLKLHNPALTPEDLMEMDGEKVWVEFRIGSAFISRYHDVKISRTMLIDSDGWHHDFSNIGNYFTVYKHKPEQRKDSDMKIKVRCIKSRTDSFIEQKIYSWDTQKGGVKGESGIWYDLHKTIEEWNKAQWDRANVPFCKFEYVDKPESNPMPELKTGMVVEHPNKDRYLVLMGTMRGNILVGIGNNSFGFNYIDSVLNSCDPKWKIIKIYQGNLSDINNIVNLPLIWELETKKFTILEAQTKLSELMGEYVEIAGEE